MSCACTTFQKYNMRLTVEVIKMKKAISIIICLSLLAAGTSVSAACGRQNKDSETSVYAVKAVGGNMKTYYEMHDGTWLCGDVIYKYRLEIKGRMPNAAVDSTFVYLSNIEEITFEQAYKAAGVSSNSEDYFSPEEAVLVEMNVRRPCER